MTLLVRTARVSYRGPDALDVTRKSAKPRDITFAPSWRILRPALDARSNGHLEEAWPGYVADYTHEMRQSYRENRERWEELLARETVTLCCYCSDPLHCHRTLLAGFLVKLGARYEGEVSP